MDTNYIVHLNNSFKRFTADEKATPFHISLYMALFHKWNSAKFRNPISISRDDLMYLSKIGSANTYTKCLKELHAWGYIKYVPSHSYHIGSKIYMSKFDTTTKSIINKTNNNASDISNSQTSVKTTTQDVRPYKNSKKQIENNKINENKERDRASKNNSEFSLLAKESSNSFSSAENANKKTIENLFQKPGIDELIAYFAEKENTSTEAEKFFNYFESNGWLIGGKTPMKNWKAAANNWILNSEKFVNERSKINFVQNHPAGKLHTITNKNYNEPL